MNDKTSPFDVIGQIGALRRYARALTRDPVDAEDLVQDALVRAYEKRPTFRSGGNLKAWLLSVLHNTHVDGLRRRRSMARRAEDAAYLQDDMRDGGQHESVRLAQVRAAFAALPEEQRAALHLVAIDELSYQEAARVLNIPVGTLMSRIARARARLREIEDGVAPVSHLKIVGGTDNDRD